MLFLYPRQRWISLRDFLIPQRSLQQGWCSATSDLEKFYDDNPQQVILILSKSPFFPQGRILQKICYPSQRMIFLEECARCLSPSRVFFIPSKDCENDLKSPADRYVYLTRWLISPVEVALYASLLVYPSSAELVWMILIPNKTGVWHNCADVSSSIFFPRSGIHDCYLCVNYWWLICGFLPSSIFLSPEIWVL